MDLFKIFKLPLFFTGSIQFLLELKLLNNNIFDQIVLNDENIKYKILVNIINPKEVEINLVLQEDNSIVLYKVTDKLVEFPKLGIGDTLIERKLSTHRNTTYLINSLTNQILIINSKTLGDKGVIQPLKLDKSFKEIDLMKFITLNIKALSNQERLADLGDSKNFNPLIITMFYMLSGYLTIERLTNTDSLAVFNRITQSEDTLKIPTQQKITILSQLLKSFLESRYHKYTLYIHNLIRYDLDLLSTALQLLFKTNQVKIEPVVKDGGYISMKIRFGYSKNFIKYRYYILLHSSSNILPLSLKDLVNSLLFYSPEFVKLHDPLTTTNLINDYYNNLKNNLKNENLNIESEVKLIRELEKQ